MEVESTIRVIKFVVKYANLCGIFPFELDSGESESIRIIIRKEWKFFLWKIRLTFMILVKLLMIGNFCKLALIGEFDLKDSKDMLNLLMLSGFGFCLLFEVHLVLRMEELLRVLNEILIYYKGFIERYSSQSNAGKHKCGAFLGYLIGATCMLGAFGIPSISMLDCDFHMLAPFYPQICREEFPIGWLLVLYIFQSLFIFYSISAVLFGMILCVPICILGCDIVKEASTESGLTIPELKDWDQWTQNYRCWQLIIQALNNCICQPLLGFVIAFDICENILLLYVLIEIKDLHGFIKFVDINYQAVLIGCYYCIFYKISACCTNCDEVLAVQSKSCDSEYRVKHFKSFPRIRCSIGNFTKIYKVTLFIVLDIIISNTASLIIMKKAKV